MLRPRLPVLILALSLAACGREEVRITAEPARSTQPEPAPEPRGPGGPEVTLPATGNGVLPPGAADKILPVGGQPIVRVLERGAEPRGDLSYALVKGTSQRMNMAMDMAMGIRVQGQTMPQTPIPRMTMAFDTAATDRSSSGDVKIDSLLTGVTVDANGGQQEQMARALRPQMEALKGLGMGYWVSPKGRVRDVKLAMPAGVPPAAQQLLNGMSQSFESMVTPLPGEAVGVGARWQVVSRTATGGADLLQSAIYTLKARNGDHATLDLALTQLSASDTIHNPQMPAGMAAKVRAFHSGGTGTTQIDLKSVAPEGAAMTLKTAMDISVQGGTSADESSVETTTTVTVSRP